MSAIVPAIETTTSVTRIRRAVSGKNLGVLADIYQEESNIVIWQRKLPEALSIAANRILDSKPNLQISVSVGPEDALKTLSRMLGTEREALTLANDIAALVDMFCYLFEITGAGLRLTTLDHAMCPRFHVDRVPCRLVTTYTGKATEWLPHDRVDRIKLGPGSEGKPDEQSGLFSNAEDIQQLREGDVALLKGECWEGNKEAGLVHRSPQLNAGARRLLLTLDFTVQ